VLDLEAELFFTQGTFRTKKATISSTSLIRTSFPTTAFFSS